MATFTTRKAMTVCLYDDAGTEIGEANLRRGAWLAPSEEHAEAMRRQLPLLVEYGIREIADDEEPEKPKLRRGRHIAGPVSTQQLAEKLAEKPAEEPSE